MYHEEKVIDGILSHRGTPDGKWIPFTQEELTNKLQNWHNVRHSLMDILDKAANYDYLKSQAQNLIALIYTYTY